MVKGKTKTGFQFEVDPEIISDAEFLEKFVAIRNGDGLVVFSVLDDLLGAEQKKALYDHCRTDAGRVPLEAVSNEFSDICDSLTKNDETKN